MERLARRSIGHNDTSQHGPPRRLKPIPCAWSSVPARKGVRLSVVALVAVDSQHVLPLNRAEPEAGSRKLAAGYWELGADKSALKSSLNVPWGCARWRISGP